MSHRSRRPGVQAPIDRETKFFVAPVPAASVVSLTSPLRPGTAGTVSSMRSAMAAASGNTALTPLPNRPKAAVDAPLPTLQADASMSPLKAGRSASAARPETPQRQVQLHADESFTSGPAQRRAQTPGGRPGTAQSWLSFGSGTSSNRRPYPLTPAPDGVLARPLSGGLKYAAQIADFAELAERGIWSTSEDDLSHISHADVDVLFDARCVDQRCPAIAERRLRFHALMSEKCRGQWFVLRQAGFGAHSIGAVSKMLLQNDHITHLDLSGNNVGLAGAQALSALLRYNGSICVLRLQSANLGDGMVVLADALKANRTLTALDLGAIGGIHRNCVWGAAATALSEAIGQHQTMAHLNVSACGLQRAAGELLQHARQSVSLTYLNLSSNHVDDTAADALAAMLGSGTAPLATLDLSRNSLTSRGIRKLCNGLQMRDSVVAEHLRHLDLSRNEITAPGVKELGAVVHDTPLEVLNLSHNRPCVADANLEGTRPAPSMEGLARLFEGLHAESTLKQLLLDHCDIPALPQAQLSAALASTTTLSKLDVSDNGFGDAGLAVLADGLIMNESVQTLNVTFIGATSIGLKALARAVRRHTVLQHLRVHQSGQRADVVQSGLVDAVLKSQSVLSTDFVDSPAIAVQPRLDKNHILMLQRATPALAEARRRVYVQERSLELTRGQIDEEVKFRDKLLEGVRLTRDRQKAAAAQHRAEIHDLTEVKNRQQQITDKITDKFQALDDDLQQRTQDLDLIRATLTKKVEHQMQKRYDMITRLNKQLTEHFARCPGSDLELPYFFQPAGRNRSSVGATMSGSPNRRKSNVDGGQRSGDGPQAPNTVALAAQLAERRKPRSEDTEREALIDELRVIQRDIDEYKSTCIALQRRDSHAEEGTLAASPRKGKATTPSKATPTGKPGNVSPTKAPPVAKPSAKKTEKSDKKSTDKKSDKKAKKPKK